MDVAKRNNYTNYIHYNTTPAQDAQALAAANSYSHTLYSGKGCNCQNMVEDALKAAGVPAKTGYFPNQFFLNNTTAHGGTNNGEGLIK